MKLLLEIPDGENRLCVVFYGKSYFAEYWRPVEGRPDLWHKSMVAEIVGTAMVRRSDAPNAHLTICNQNAQAILDVVLVDKVMQA